MFYRCGLSRAGKTRGHLQWYRRWRNVPEPEPAKKKLTGRAKKRLLYNKRILNGHTMIGGPNCQSGPRGTFHKPSADGPVLNKVRVGKKRLQFASSNSADAVRLEDTIGYSRATYIDRGRPHWYRSHHQKTKGVDYRDKQKDRRAKVALFHSVLRAEDLESQFV